MTGARHSLTATQISDRLLSSPTETVHDTIASLERLGALVAAPYRQSDGAVRWRPLVDLNDISLLEWGV